MNASGKRSNVRLTMAQAIVRYLAVQYSERDAHVQRLVPAMFGIFGHGNVAGLGQALEELGRDLPYYQPCNEQAMVHMASGFDKATCRRQGSFPMARSRSSKSSWRKRAARTRTPCFARK